MLLIDRIRCVFGRHHPDRAKVKTHGSLYKATCRTCGAKIEREMHGSWHRVK